MYPELVFLYIVAGAFTAALAGLTMPTGQSSLPATFISMSICLLWPLFFGRYFQLLAKPAVAYAHGRLKDMYGEAP
jgi:hypothetical protein